MGEVRKKGEEKDGIVRSREGGRGGRRNKKERRKADEKKRMLGKKGIGERRR